MTLEEKEKERIKHRKEVFLHCLKNTKPEDFRKVVPRLAVMLGFDPERTSFDNEKLRSEIRIMAIQSLDQELFFHFTYGTTTTKHQCEVFKNLLEIDDPLFLEKCISSDFLSDLFREYEKTEDKDFWNDVDLGKGVFCARWLIQRYKIPATASNSDVWVRMCRRTGYSPRCPSIVKYLRHNLVWKNTRAKELFLEFLSAVEKSTTNDCFKVQWKLFRFEFYTFFHSDENGNYCTDTPISRSSNFSTLWNDSDFWKLFLFVLAIFIGVMLPPLF